MCQTYGSSRRLVQSGRQVNWRDGGVVLSKQARRGSRHLLRGALYRSRAAYPRLPSTEFDQVSSFLSRECPLALPAAHPILPTPSTVATDTRLVAILACIPLSDRNSQLTRTRAEDCARARSRPPHTHRTGPPWACDFLSFGPNSFTLPTSLPLHQHKFHVSSIDRGVKEIAWSASRSKHHDPLRA